jgi:hypothetical protein
MPEGEIPLLSVWDFMGIASLYDPDASPGATIEASERY